jgi:hypothetical protein
VRKKRFSVELLSSSGATLPLWLETVGTPYYWNRALLSAR